MKRLVALVLVLFALTTPSAAAAPAQPPKLDVQAAIRALSTSQVYRAPGSVAHYDEQLVAKALGTDIKLLVEPYTGEFGKGNYATGDDYSKQVYEPLSDWATQHKIKLVDVTGLYVRSYADGGGAFGPSDLPEIRTQTAYLDVTNALLGMIAYIRTGATNYPSPAPPPLVPPAPAQLAAVAGPLRADRVYNAPDRTTPISLDANFVQQKTGFTVRVAAFPPIPVGQPMVDYAPALAKQFPNDEILVNYGQWIEVAGPNPQALQSARDYAYGRYDDATLEQGADMANRIGTILLRTYELVRTHPFSKPQPPPYDLRQQISSVAPWALLGSAAIIGGGALAVWLRRRAEADRTEKVALSRESALATAAIAALGAKLLHEDAVPTDAAAERLATANAMFGQARTPEAMREVRRIAEQGEEALRA